MSRVNIPKIFKLFGNKIRVRWVSTLISTDRLYGRTDFVRFRIFLQSRKEGAPLTRRVREQAFWHETTHQILSAIGENEFNDDEARVERLAQAIHQVLRTSKGDLQ